jgi:Flp pilus assembly protein TadG
MLTRRTRRGQALVETAMVLPFMILLVMGVIDVGRLLFAHVALQEATQEGALYGAFHPTNSTAIKSRVKASSGAQWVTGATVEVCQIVSPAPGRVRVTSTYPLQLLTPVIPDVLGTGTVTLRSVITSTNFSTTDLSTAGCS